MQPNMGTADRLIRVLIAVAIFVAWYMGVISGTIAIVALIMVGVLILTSLFSFCPLYLPFGLSTLFRQHKPTDQPNNK